jgi:hypothetical protein
MPLGPHGKLQNGPPIEHLQLGKAKESGEKMERWGEFRGTEDAPAVLWTSESQVQSIMLLEMVAVSKAFDQFQSTVIATHQDVLPVVQSRPRLGFAITMGASPQLGFGFEEFNRVPLPCEVKGGCATGKSSADNRNPRGGASLGVGLAQLAPASAQGF